MTETMSPSSYNSAEVNSNGDVEHLVQFDQFIVDLC